MPPNAKLTLSPSPSHPHKIPIGTQARYTCDAGYESFGSGSMTCSGAGVWVGEPPFCGANVAKGRPANQSTTVRGGAAGNANDGELTTEHDGRRCTETQREASPWWSVDLLRTYSIKVVRVTTRGCCGKLITNI